MQIRQDHKYEHSVDVVLTLFTDAAEVEAKQEALGARNIRIEECELYDDGADITFVRELPADVPAILSRFLQPWNTVEQSEQWRSCDGGGYDAALSIDIANVPVTVAGTLELEPEDGGCVNHICIDIVCSIPFVGKTLAEFVAADCERLIASEYDYIVDRLSSG